MFFISSHALTVAPGALRPAGRATIEALEDRQFFSAMPALAHASVVSVPKTQTATFANKIAKNGTTTMLPLNINAVQLQNGQLVALGNLGSTPLVLPISLNTSPNAADPTCPILNLHLNPIHLNLLGLHVDTSAICLSITAHSGGGLLGNLLCDVANLLNQGVPLGGILGGLTGTQLSQLLGGIAGLLNGVLGNLTAPAAVTGVGSSGGAACNVLQLSLGPVDLNLLGLQVHLDNCNNGPVTVSITAQPGAGNLLGNLLCTVDNLLNNPSNPTALANLLTRVANEIASLI